MDGLLNADRLRFMNSKDFLTKFSAKRLAPALAYRCVLVPGLIAALQIGVVPAASASSNDKLTRTVDSSFETIIRTVEGDTFATLGYKVFGSAAMGRLLAEYNELAFSTEFEAGQEIIIPTHIDSKNNFATVAFVKGDTTLHVAGSDQTTRSLSTGDQIYTTDIIVTGNSGFVSTVLSNGSVVNVQPGSRVTLKELSCLPRDANCTFSMDSERGSLSSDVRTREGQSNRFLIKTPYASAAVRGTIFDFDADASTMRVGVTEGEVSLLAGTKDLSLPTGFGSLTDEDKGLGEAIELLGSPDFLPAPKRLGEQDRVAWSEVNGAESYVMSVTSDANGNQEIYRETASQPVHDLRAIESGTAYLRVRGLDANQLKGFAGVAEMNIVTVDPDLPKPTLDLEKDGNEIYVSLLESSSEQTHELQFSELEDFSTLVSVDIPHNGGAIRRIEPDRPYYVRGRVVAGESSVGQYGPVMEIEAGN